MKSFYRSSLLPLLMTLAVVLLLSACTGGQVKTSGPNAAQQNVYLFGGDVGAVLIAADTYQALNDCSAPGHTMPCSTVAKNARVQKAKEDLLKARNKARDLVRTPGFDQGSLSTITAEIQAAIDLIYEITGTTPLGFVPSWITTITTVASSAAIVPLTGAQVYLALLLQVLGWAKAIFGAGSKIHTFTDKVVEEVKRMQAENNRAPNDAEWAAQDEVLNELVKQPPQAQPGQ